MTEEIQRALGRVEGKLDSLIAAMNTHVMDDDNNFSKTGERIGRVERKVYWFTGAWMTVGAVIAYLFKH